MRIIFTVIYLSCIALYLKFLNQQIENLEYDVFATSSDYNQIAFLAIVGLLFCVFGGIFIIRLDAYKPKG